ncbi:type II toxin-antitoxin system VapC family toxin [Sphingomonas sp. CROZ-RG-20F-R02-07]|uniref:type II toxin-antitoxin system VapC family toxin n=1 Tax=Sphingomonas sp. CROZ-RG-20F-R02-07 TaxID=2914832 RepID=UPI001F5A67BD|nr:type II toxin-antitoxin system VapC family toxin [Sphingomonas sp. CROZ-RG-20F-R02-07]
MPLYPDTSILVSAYTEELYSEIAENWLRSSADEEMMASLWCEMEMASALGAKTRAGIIAPAERQRLLMIVRSLLRDSMTLISVEPRHFALAADLLARSTKPLRAADGLHLAIAADAGATLWTLDGPMAAAGQALGLDVRLLAR